MKRDFTLSFVIALLGVSAAPGQQLVRPMQAQEMSRIELAAGYHLVNANAPPGECGCFTAHGGFVGAQFNLSPWLGAAGEVSGMHASSISSLGQNLFLTTFMAGPRVSWPGHRIVPFGEFMAGGAHAGDSYFPSSSAATSSASSFAYATGGGVDFNWSPRFAIRMFDATFLHTGFPNGVNQTQRQLQINVGMVAHFGGAPTASYRSVPVASGPKATRSLSLACWTSTMIVKSGQPVHVTGETSLDPDQFPISYSWSTTGGVIESHANVVTVDTRNLLPGNYTVSGRAALDSNPSSASSCKTSFEIARSDEDLRQQLMTKVSAPPAESSSDLIAQSHLRDLFFNYDQSDIRPDAVAAVSDDANYLISHPEIAITIAGYADERGSAEYNIALGMQRAQTTREALISSGVEGSRIDVMSYGKERPFCTDDTESCYQQNRRAQFVVFERK